MRFKRVQGVSQNNFSLKSFAICTWYVLPCVKVGLLETDVSDWSEQGKLFFKFISTAIYDTGCYKHSLVGDLIQEE